MSIAPFQGGSPIALLMRAIQLGQYPMAAAAAGGPTLPSQRGRTNSWDTTGRTTGGRPAGPVVMSQGSLPYPPGTDTTTAQQQATYGVALPGQIQWTPDHEPGVWNSVKAHMADPSVQAGIFGAAA